MGKEPRPTFDTNPHNQNRIQRLGLTSKLPLRRYKHRQTMRIIKVEYVLINVCFHLLVVLAKVGRFLVVSLEN